MARACVNVRRRLRKLAHCDTDAGATANAAGLLKALRLEHPDLVSEEATCAFGELPADLNDFTQEIVDAYVSKPFTTAFGAINADPWLYATSCASKRLRCSAKARRCTAEGVLRAERSTTQAQGK